jgi:hypothetical protein
VAAATWALLGGCGGGSDGGAADASGPTDGGAGFDGAVPDGRPIEGPIEIRIVKESYPPVDGAPVLFYDAAGVFISETATDADGVVTAVVTTSSTAVILLPEYDFTDNESIVVGGVEPGDSILFFDADWPEDIPGRQIDVEVAPYPGATSYRFRTCTESYASSPQTTLYVPDRCVVDGRLAISVLATANGGLMAYLHDDVQAGPAVVLEGTWGAPDPLEVSLAGIPAAVKTISARVWMMAGDQPYDEFGPVEGTVDGPSMTLSPMDGPASFGAERVVSLQFLRVQRLFAIQYGDHRIAGDTSGLALDVGDELLPWYTGPAYSPETQTLSWTRSASGRPPDALYVNTYWEETGSDGRGTIHWIVPPEASTMVVPPLPEAHATRLPQRPRVTVHQLTAVERSDWDGYRDARQTGWLETHPEHHIGAPFAIRRSFAGSP